MKRKYSFVFFFFFFFGGGGAIFAPPVIVREAPYTQQLQATADRLVLISAAGVSVQDDSWLEYGIRSRGGGGGDGDGGFSPQYLRSGITCIIIPQYFKIECYNYTGKISELPTKTMKEIAGLECRNVENFLPRSQCGCFAGSLWGVYALPWVIYKSETALNVPVTKWLTNMSYCADKSCKYQLKHWKK